MDKDDKKEVVDKTAEKGGDIISESFQREAQAFVKGRNKKELAYLRDCVYECEAKARKEEFDTEGMPA